jgi:hypothetical protein
MAMWSSRDPGRSYSYIERGCSLGDARLCITAAGLCAVGEGTPKSADHALALRERACELGSKEACRDAANAWRSRKDDPNGARAERLYQRAEAYDQLASLAAERADSLCHAPLPHGREGCLEGLRAAKASLAKVPGMSAEEQDATYGAFIRAACVHVRLDECEKYRDDPAERMPDYAQ